MKNSVIKISNIKSMTTGITAKDTVIGVIRAGGTIAGGQILL